MKLAKCKPPVLAPETWGRWGWLVLSVSQRHGLRPAVVLGRSREQRVTRARRDLCVCLYASGLGYGEIGRMLGLDHTSVLYAVRKELAS